jgi:hypothetical protein
MKEIPKKDRPDVSGGALPEYPQVPCFPNIWPREVEDGPTFPEKPGSPCESPTTA